MKKKNKNLRIKQPLDFSREELNRVSHNKHSVHLKNVKIRNKRPFEATISTSLTI